MGRPVVLVDRGKHLVFAPRVVIIPFPPDMAAQAVPAVSPLLTNLGLGLLEFLETLEQRVILALLRLVYLITLQAAQGVTREMAGRAVLAAIRELAEVMLRLMRGGPVQGLLAGVVAPLAPREVVKVPPGIPEVAAAEAGLVFATQAMTEVEHCGAQAEILEAAAAVQVRRAPLALGVPGIPRVQRGRGAEVAVAVR